jgi:hypothetical protein
MLSVFLVLTRDAGRLSACWGVGSLYSCGVVLQTEGLSINTICTRGKGCIGGYKTMYALGGGRLPGMEAERVEGCMPIISDFGKY